MNEQTELEMLRTENARLKWLESAYEKLVYQWRDTHMTLSNELDVDFDPEGSDTRYVEAINCLKVKGEVVQS